METEDATVDVDCEIGGCEGGEEIIGVDGLAVFVTRNVVLEGPVRVVFEDEDVVVVADGVDFFLATERGDYSGRVLSEARCYISYGNSCYSKFTKGRSTHDTV